MATADQLNAVVRLESLSGPDWTVEAVMLDSPAGVNCDSDDQHGPAMCELAGLLCLDCAVDMLRNWYLVQGAHITVEVFR